MDLNVGDVIVDLDWNGKEMGNPYTVTEEFLHEYNPDHCFWAWGQPGIRIVKRV